MRLTKEEAEDVDPLLPSAERSFIPLSYGRGGETALSDSVKAKMLISEYSPIRGLTRVSQSQLPHTLLLSLPHTPLTQDKPSSQSALSRSKSMVSSSASSLIPLHLIESIAGKNKSSNYSPPIKQEESALPRQHYPLRMQKLQEISTLSS